MPYRPAHFLPFLLGLTLLLAACAGDPADSALLPGAGGPDCSDAAVGDVCGGGIVYTTDYQSTGTVLVAAAADEGGGASYLYKTSADDTLNAEDTNDGRANTGTFNSAHPASWACQLATHNGYDDWYLPAINELNELFASAAAGMSGGHWSSTEVGSTPGNALLSAGGAPSQTAKNSGYAVRCIRRP